MIFWWKYEKNNRSLLGFLAFASNSNRILSWRFPRSNLILCYNEFISFFFFLETFFSPFWYLFVEFLFSQMFWSGKEIWMHIEALCHYYITSSNQCSVHISHSFRIRNSQISLVLCITFEFAVKRKIMFLFRYIL